MTTAWPGCILRLFSRDQAQRLFRDRLADTESRTRFDGMLNAQLRSVWSHTADLTGVRCSFCLENSRTIAALA